MKEGQIFGLAVEECRGPGHFGGAEGGWGF